MHNNVANCLLVAWRGVRYTIAMVLRRCSALSLIVLAAAVLEGCIDTCVLSGKACNVSSDCEGGEVCLYPGPNDVGCPVVTGTCGLGDCGNDADCASGCCNLETRQCGVAFDECATPQCSSADDCSGSEECISGACRSTCNEDIDCPGSERCRGTCQAAIGTVCSIDADFGDCFYGDCMNTNLAGEEVASYCTDSCSDFSSDPSDKDACPPGYECVDIRCIQR